MRHWKAFFAVQSTKTEETIWYVGAQYAKAALHTQPLYYILILRNLVATFCSAPLCIFYIIYIGSKSITLDCMDGTTMWS